MKNISLKMFKVTFYSFLKANETIPFIEYDITIMFIKKQIINKGVSYKQT